jgi:secondary thiamine-phosphate synthase enzyme
MVVSGFSRTRVRYYSRLPEAFVSRNIGRILAENHMEFPSKSSTVTVREKPMEGVATATAGGVTIHGETFVIDTDQRIELVDLTNRIMEFVRRFDIREGMLSIWSMHTTCTLLINEFQGALLSDIKRFLEQMVARDADYLHNDPNHSDCDRQNADSHLRAMLLGHSLTLQISGGEVVLGQWQRILMAELDGPRARSLRVQVFGVS